MSKHPALTEERRAEIVEECRQHLVAARQDVGDPELCFEFLYDLQLCPWQHLEQCFDAALAAAGQTYIDRDVQRRVA